MQAHVLSVGQCAMDDARISRLLAVEADAHLDRAPTLADARRLLAERAFDLVLVNRIIDGDGNSGLSFIEELNKSGPVAPLPATPVAPIPATAAVSLPATPVSSVPTTPTFAPPTFAPPTFAAPTMLVSDYPDAQATAIAAGALPGFGKSALGHAELGQMLRQVLHSAPRAGLTR